MRELMLGCGVALVYLGLRAIGVPFSASFFFSLGLTLVALYLDPTERST